MRNVTTIKQAKEMASILPIESADCFYKEWDLVQSSTGKSAATYQLFELDRMPTRAIDGEYELLETFFGKDYTRIYYPDDYTEVRTGTFNEYDVPAWSLGALMEAIPCISLRQDIHGLWSATSYYNKNNDEKKCKTAKQLPTAVDACIDLIKQLHEEGVL